MKFADHLSKSDIQKFWNSINLEEAASRVNLNPGLL